MAAPPVASPLLASAVSSQPTRAKVQLQLRPSVSLPPSSMVELPGSTANAWTSAPHSDSTFASAADTMTESGELDQIQQLPEGFAGAASPSASTTDFRAASAVTATNVNESTAASAAAVRPTSDKLVAADFVTSSQPQSSASDWSRIALPRLELIPYLAELVHVHSKAAGCNVSWTAPKAGQVVPLDTPAPQPQPQPKVVRP